MNLTSPRTWREARRQITNRWYRFYNSIWMPIVVIVCGLGFAAFLNTVMP